jgi:SgrR family transcriptional regulator
MRLYKQYLQLYRHLLRDDKNCVDVTLDEIADVLQCTHRNASLLLAKMTTRELIEWSPQRGRGRRSILRFITPTDEISKIIVRDAISRNESLSMLHEVSSDIESDSVKEQLYDLLFNQYGLQTEIRNRKRIDTLRLPIRQPIVTLDPLYMNVLTESFVASHVFDSLVRRDDREQGISPHLAHAWETDESRLNWTFYLRKGVVFHNGKDFDSEDVVYSMNRLLQSEHRILYRSVFKKMKRVYAIDRYTIRIELAERNELFLSFLSTTRAAIIPSELGFIGEAKFQHAPIGTGPFKVESVTSEVCTLAANPGYFRERAHLDRVEIWQLPSEKTQQADIFRVIHNAGQDFEHNKSWVQVDSAVSVYKFITVNMNHSGPLSDRATRAEVFGALTSSKTTPLDQTQQRKTDRRPLILSTITPYELDAQRIADQLQAQQIPVVIKLYSPEEFKGDVRLASDIVLFSLIRDQDEHLRLYDLYRTMAEHLEPLAKTDIDTSLRKITRETDSSERDRLYGQIADRLTREFSMLILYGHNIQTVFHHTVRGISFNAQGWVDLRTIWFATRE